MANNIYHKSNWGSPEKDDWGDVYFNPSATNKLYTRSDNYENSDGTDKALASKPDTQSVLMTPTAYSVGSMNSILPTNGNGNFTFDRNSTATRVNKEGLIETVAIDTPRLDYPLIDGVVQSEPALLLEPAATNFLQYSEDYTQTEWSRANINTPVLQTSVIAPDGSTNVYLITNSATSNPIIFDNEIGSSTNDSTFSVFVKYYNNKYFKLRIDAPTKNVLFNIQDGYIVDENTSVNGKIEDYGNGWYRCSITHTALTTAGNAVISINDSGSISNNILQTTGLGCYIFGAQYEVNAYPTSYIKTTGSSVTRAAETANGAGTSDDFNDSEGVLFAEISALHNDLTNRVISISNSTSTSNRVMLLYQIDSNKIRGQFSVSGQTRRIIDYDKSDTTITAKTAIKYDSTNIKLYVNGFEIREVATGFTIADGTLTELAFDNVGTGHFYGRTKEVGVFKTALTDSELEALTSWDSFSDMATGQEYTIR